MLTPAVSRLLFPKDIAYSLCIPFESSHSRLIPHFYSFPIHPSIHLSNIVYADFYNPEEYPQFPRFFCHVRSHTTSFLHVSVKFQLYTMHRQVLINCTVKHHNINQLQVYSTNFSTMDSPSNSSLLLWGCIQYIKHPQSLFLQICCHTLAFSPPFFFSLCIPCWF